MSDYLVKLQNIDFTDTERNALAGIGCTSRRPLAPEKSIVIDWVRKNFSQNWADECEVSFSTRPPSCFIAIHNNEVVGFACFNVVFNGMFGPTGVAASMRGKGLGKALLIRSLTEMRSMGFAYAIIGSGEGAADFYKKTVGAVPIESDDQDIFQNLLIPHEEPAS